MSRKAALWHWSLLSSHVEVRRMCLGSGLRHLRDNILPLGNATGKRLWVIPCPVPEVRCVYENECAAKSLSRSWLFAFKTWWLCVCVQTQYLYILSGLKVLTACWNTAHSLQEAHTGNGHCIVAPVRRESSRSFSVVSEFQERVTFRPLRTLVQRLDVLLLDCIWHWCLCE